MRKLENFYDIINSQQFKDLEKLENDFKTKIIQTINPKQVIKDWLNDPGNTTEDQIAFLTELLNKIEDYILFKPEELQTLTAAMNDNGTTVRLFRNRNPKTNRFKKTDFSSELFLRLNYTSKIGGGELGKELARILNIRACLYCNAQYSFAYKFENKQNARLQLDHFFSSSKYPYLSISLYNLIPSCSHCNQKKSGKDFDMINYCHPYVESFADLFEFNLDEESETKILGKILIKESDLNIRLVYKDPKVEKHDKAFDLTGIYENFKKDVVELHKFSKAYPKIKIKEILSIEDKNGNKLFESEDDFKRLVTILIFD